MRNSIIASVGIDPPGQTGGSSAPIDTTGANEIVAAVVCSAIPTPTFSDNMGNVYPPYDQEPEPGSNAKGIFYRLLNPVVGPNHIFTVGGGTLLQAAAIVAFKTVTATNFFTTGGQATSTTVQTGPMTPNGSPAAVFSMLIQVIVPPYVITVDNGFTIDVQVPLKLGQHYGIALAHKFYPKAELVNLRWTSTVSGGLGTGGYYFVLAPTAFNQAL